METLIALSRPSADAASVNTTAESMPPLLPTMTWLKPVFAR